MKVGEDFILGLESHHNECFSHRQRVVVLQTWDFKIRCKRSLLLLLEVCSDMHEMLPELLYSTVGIFMF